MKVTFLKDLYLIVGLKSARLVLAKFHSLSLASLILNSLKIKIILNICQLGEVSISIKQL